MVKSRSCGNRSLLRSARLSAHPIPQHLRINLHLPAYTPLICVGGMASVPSQETWDETELVPPFSKANCRAGASACRFDGRQPGMVALQNWLFGPIGPN